ncbi:MAG: hypothetical protein FP814_09980 [Desulfobacterium sp.]|nr:hypothetical protein [Desulfobacterium sp.]
MIGLNMVLSVALLFFFIRIKSTLFLALVLSGALSMAFVGMQVLLVFIHSLISPDDYEIIGPRPVSSKTLYVAKVLLLFIFTGILTASQAIIPTIVVTIIYQNPWLVLIIPVVFLISNITGASILIVMYTLALKLISQKRLELFFGIIPLGMMVIFYSMSLLLSDFEQLLNHTDTSALWLKFLPTYWLTGWYRLIFDGWSWPTAVGTAAVYLFAYFLARSVLKYLSPEYGEYLSRTRTIKEIQPKRKIPSALTQLWHRITGFEDRAVALLIKAEFSHDNHFRLNVLCFIAMGIFVTLDDGATFVDPFIGGTLKERMSGFFLYWMMLLLPMVIYAEVLKSNSWQGAWIFHASPANRLKLVTATKRLSILFFYLPACITLATILSFFFHNVWHAIAHSVFIFVIGLVGMTLAIISRTRLPFASAHANSEFSTEIAIMMVASFPLLVVLFFGYGSITGWAIMTSVAYILFRLLVLWQNSRIKSKVRHWEFMP